MKARWFFLLPLLFVSGISISSQNDFFKNIVKSRAQKGGNGCNLYIYEGPYRGRFNSNSQVGNVHISDDSNICAVYHVVEAPLTLRNNVFSVGNITVEDGNYHLRQIKTVIDIESIKTNHNIAVGNIGLGSKNNVKSVEQSVEIDEIDVDRGN